jgi:hypothetical protein
MLGVYDNFPLSVHRTERFITTISTRPMQQKLIQVLQEINRKEFNSSDLIHPSLQNSKIIFEMGIADGKNFNFIDKEETKRIRNAFKRDTPRTIDLFCATRYIRDEKEKKTLHRFDYFMTRISFSDDLTEIQVFHERGPRYLSPEDLIAFLANEVNKTSSKRILRSSYSY